VIKCDTFRKSPIRRPEAEVGRPAKVLGPFTDHPR